MVAASSVARVPTVLCIDIEPDDTPPQLSGRWPGFESLLAYTDELRDRLAHATGAPVRFTWTLRMDPQIQAVQGSPTWVAERYATELDRLRQAGDAFATHTHAWRHADRGNSDAWVADWGDPVWADECLEMSLDAFATAMGRPCEVHRFGDRYISPRLHALLGARGVKVDLTVEPGARPVGALYPGWHSTSRTIDFAAAPRAPYLPDPRDLMRAAPDPNTAGPWLLPLTAVDASDSLPLWRRLAREIRYPGRVRHRPIVLWATGPADALWQAVERDVAVAAKPYLAFAIRSNVLLSPRSEIPLREKVDALLRSPLARRLVLTDPLSALAMLKGELAERPPG